MNVWQLAFGVAFSALIAWAGYRQESLSRSGVVGAILVGTLTFGLGGWTWGLLLIAFFISSSLLSHYRKDDKRGLAEKFAKTSRRDLGQALANGGWGAILAIAYFCQPDPILFAAFVGATAAVNADTWATELGVLSPTSPRLITTGQRVPAGTSGGVTVLGTAASLGGGLFVGLMALALGQESHPGRAAALRRHPTARPRPGGQRDDHPGHRRAADGGLRAGNRVGRLRQMQSAGASLRGRTCVRIPTNSPPTDDRY